MRGLVQDVISTTWSWPKGLVIAWLVLPDYDIADIAQIGRETAFDVYDPY